MMRRASNGIEMVPYCFSRSSFQFQGHMGKNASSAPISAFLDKKSGFNSRMIIEWSERTKWTTIYCLGTTEIIVAKWSPKAS